MIGENNKILKKLVCAGIVGLVLCERRTVMVTKKSGLIIVVVLLAFAPLAEADFQIGTRYLDDSPFNPDTDILDIGDSLYLSIYAEEFFADVFSSSYYWELTCDPSLATITGGVLGPDAYDGRISDHPSGRMGWFMYEFVPEYPAGLYADEFLYSPQSVGDVTVEFWGDRGNLGGYMFFIDSVVISQVPEPMTITLLALGGLFLRRRRSCSK